MGEAMVTYIDMLILMVAYAGVTLSGGCLIWHLSNTGLKPPRQWTALRRIFQASFPGH